MTRSTLPLLLLLACGRSTTARDVTVAPAAPTTVAVAPASDTNVPTTGSGPPPGPPADGYADIATDPVHVWIGRGADGVTERLFIVGHANETCCRMITGLVDASLTLGTIDGDFYHGFADVRLKDTPDSILALQEFAAFIRQARNSEAECARQVHVHEFATATHAADVDRLLGDAEYGFALATALNRPLLLWNDNFDAAPQFAPVLVPAGGRLTPLQFELATSELRLPRALRSDPSVFRDEIRDARALLARMKNFGAIFAELRELVTSNTDLVIRQDRVKVAGDAIATTIAELRGYNRCLERARGLWRRLERAFRDFNVPDDTPTRTIRQLDEFARDNNESLQRLGELGEIGNAEFPVTRCEQTVVTFDRKMRRKVLQFDARPIVARLEKEVEHWRTLAANFNTSQLVTTLDAGLRGVNLSSSDEQERVFDGWMMGNQLALWDKLRGQATARGITLGPADSPAGVLHASNMVLRVETFGERVRLTPHFVLTGPFYQVVNPAAKLVYYESVLAEHHLSPDPQ